MDTESILAYHRAHAWQPFTQMKLTPDPVVIDSARGVYLKTSDGDEIIDAVGSWWVNIHGHNHEYVNAAIEKQLRQLEHVMYAGFTHEPAARLSKRLSDTTGGELPRVFFSDNGSTAVEIGLKMAFQFYVNQGRPEKKNFVTLTGGYHGDPIGTMSVGARSVFHEMYEPLLFSVFHAPAPSCPFEALYDEARAQEAVRPAISALEKILEEHGKTICGLILEPLIQGAGGMNIYPGAYLRAVRALCDAHDVMLVADEVFTGCGRTGAFYACERAGIWPDIMALSKGLSAGYLAFAATLASERVFQGFYSDDRRHTLFHGHSMTANPLGCAAAHASLDLFERENLLGKVLELEESHGNHLRAMETGALGKHIRETRCMGSVGAVEFDLDIDYTGDFGWRVWSTCIAEGVLLRPIGNVVYLTPPYVIQADELEKCYGVLEKTVLEIMS